MGKYLDRFSSTIPAVQAKQIFQLLNEFKDSGALKSVNEYNRRLQELSTHLRNTNPTPIFKLFEMKIGETIDSDRFNAMVKAATMDLETAFAEAQNIAEVLEIHKNLFKLTVLKSLHNTIDELDKNITLYEFFARDQNGFTSAQYNTFNNSDSGLSFSGTGEFYDHRRRIGMDLEDMCATDALAQRLTLPTTTKEEIKITNVDLVDDEETVHSEIDGQNATSSLQNIRDMQRFTYWTYPIILSSKLTDGATIKIKLDLGGIRQFNMLEVEPACPYPMTLYKIEYVGADNSLHEVIIDSTMVTDTSYDLGDIQTQFLLLTFKQENAEEAIYYYDRNRDLWERTWTDGLDIEEPDVARIDRINDELRDEIQDNTMRDILGIGEEAELSRVAIYQYTFGIDNVRLYNTSYRSKGMFVSQPFAVVKPGLVGLKTTEEIPTVMLGNTEYPRFSFEYSLLKFDFAEDGSFLDQEILPLLSLQSDGDVVHERLFLLDRDSSATANVATLRFTPDVATQIPTVYKNLTDTLVIGDPTLEATDYIARAEGQVDWQTSWEDVRTYINAYSESQTPPMTIYIKFINPSLHSIYTASYQVSTRQSDSASNSKQRKLSEYTVINDSLTLRCNPSKKSTIASSELFLVIIMRNNYLGNTITPSLYDYKLLVSSYDSEKYNI